MRGRKPKPTALKMLAGNPGKVALNRDEPHGELASGRAPRWLPKGAARHHYQRLARVLLAVRVLTKADETWLGLTSCAIADYLDAREVPDAGTVREIAKAMADDPDAAPRLVEAIYARAKSSTAAYRAALSGLAEGGLTPSARTRIKAQPVAPDDPLREFLKRRPGAA